MTPGQIGFIQNIGGAEIVLIAIVALVVLGPERLPEMGRSAGRMINKLRTMTDGMQSEVREVMDDPSMQPIRELGEFAARPRQKLTQYALEAEAEERARRESERAAAAAAAADEAATAEGGEQAEAEPTSSEADPTAATGTPDPPPSTGTPEPTAAPETHGSGEPSDDPDPSSSS